MNWGLLLIIAGVVSGIVILIKPKFFWDNHKLARRILGDKWTFISHLIFAILMIIAGIYLLTIKL
ncbi:MAG: hypothetical protein ACHQHP_03220 [Bacteroidia bacterium]